VRPPDKSLVALAIHFWRELVISFCLLSILGESLDEGDVSSVLLCLAAIVAWLSFMLRTEPRDHEGR
jgi:hypothetical protein